MLMETGINLTYTRASWTMAYGLMALPTYVYIQLNDPY